MWLHVTSASAYLIMVPWGSQFRWGLPLRNLETTDLVDQKLDLERAVSLP